MDRVVDGGGIFRKVGGTVEWQLADAAEANDLNTQLNNLRDSVTAYFGDLPECSGPFQLTHGQAAMWALDQHEGRRCDYNIRCLLSLNPDVDPDRLGRVCDGLCARHESLRSRIRASTDGARRFVLPGQQNILAVTQAEGWRTDSRDRWIGAETLRPFDLANEPPVRFSLMKIARRNGPDEAVLAITVHHLVADYVSIQCLVEELESDYQSIGRGDADAPTIEPAGSYDAHTRAERAFLSSPAGERARCHWQSELNGVLPVLRLPKRRQRCSDPPDGVELRTRLTAVQTDEVKQFARQNALTPFVVMLSAYAVLLAALDGWRAQLVGTTIDWRIHTQRACTVGQYVNVLPLRLAPEPEQSFVEMLAQAQATFVRCLRHARMPFAEIVRCVDPPRRAAVAPLVQTLFTWLKLAPQFVEPPHPDPLLRGLVRMEGAQPAPITHDLVLMVEDSGVQLDCLWSFDATRFMPAEVAWLSDTYGECVARLIAAPNASLGTTLKPAWPSAAAASGHRQVVEL